jgi:hypothetical protein
MDLRQWTPEMEAEAKRLQREYNILTNANVVEFHESEYPIDEASCYRRAGVRNRVHIGR